MRFRAVLFDWRGTLVHYLDSPAIVRRALESLGRPAADDDVEPLTKAIAEAYALPEFAEAEFTIDTSAELHRQVTMRMFERAGLDEEVAEALYPADFDPANHPVYPDVPGVLEALHGRGVRVGVVSNIHFDLRPEFEAEGISRFVDAFVLSVELGYQKPDPRFFRAALEALHIAPDEGLMVGDSPTFDGSAARVGITTLILPTLERFGPRDLGLVLDLVR